MLEFSCEILAGMLQNKIAVDQSGKKVCFRPALSETLLNAIYRTVRKLQPQVCLQIGLAQGLSALAICSAIRENGQGKLISIDPFQAKEFQGAGIKCLELAGLADRHELVEEVDYLALPSLLQNGLRTDFVYIDGWHTFDHVLLDFFYCDKMLPAGGVVALNDCGWRAVHKSLSFVKSHRHYEEINVGLPPDFRSRNPVFGIVKRLQGRNNADRYFRKLDEWQPPGDFYSNF
jgi:predicted O-methyltransferase YrrM